MIADYIRKRRATADPQLSIRRRIAAAAIVIAMVVALFILLDPHH